MRASTALLLGVVCCLLSGKAFADEVPPRLAVVPYLTLNFEAEEEQVLREVLSLEIASSGSRANVLPPQQVQNNLPPIPDGCPEDPACVAAISTPIRADYLLFIALVKSESAIEVSLLLVEAGGVGALRQAKVELEHEPSTWSVPLRKTIQDLLGGVARLAPPALDLTGPTTGPIVEPPRAKRWPWVLLGSGLVLGGAGVGAFFFVYRPASTLGAFGPGVR